MKSAGAASADGAGEAGLADPLPIAAAARPLRGAVRVPGSKSVTNRALALAALADGTSVLDGALDSDDTRHMARAISQMGAEATGVSRVRGANGGLRGGCTLHCGDGGTPARFLIMMAALADGPVVVDGSARLRERPMADAATLLSDLGVECVWRGAVGCLPIEVRPRAVPQGASLRVGRTASSQCLSALLLIAPWLPRGLHVEFTQPPVSASYILLTVSELRRWGAHVTVTVDAGGVLRAVGVAPGPLAARTASVEADASSAVYWAAAAALVEGSDIELTGMPADSVQPDTDAMRALQAMGARLTATPRGVRVACGLGVAAGGQGAPGAAPRRPPLAGTQADCAGFPDGALAVIAAAAAADSPSKFTGLGTLRVKESDRIHAMAHNLRLIGARADEGADWLALQPSHAVPRGVVIPTFRDHRVAMSFAVLGLRTGGISIADPGCVAKSYPSFWADLAALRATSQA